MSLLSLCNLGCIIVTSMLCNIKATTNFIIWYNKVFKSFWLDHSTIHKILILQNPFMNLHELCQRKLLVVSKKLLLDLESQVGIENDNSKKKKFKQWKFSRYPVHVVSNFHSFSSKDKKVFQKTVNRLFFFNTLQCNQMGMLGNGDSNEKGYGFGHLLLILAD